MPSQRFFTRGLAAPVLALVIGAVVLSGTGVAEASVPLAKEATPAAKSVLAEATRRWPSRSKASDGLLPSRQHYAQNPNSDHNDGYAVDLTHDPGHGVDTFALARALAQKNDPRVKYIISNRQIWTPGSGWAPYTSGDPHTNHMHVSILHGHGNDTSTWFTWLDHGQPSPAPASSAGTRKYYVKTFATAYGYASPSCLDDDSPRCRPQGELYAAESNYVFCKKLGDEVRYGDQHNRWWLLTDLDKVYPGKAGRAYVPAYYLSKWGNDVAKDNSGTVIPDC
jgi:hypothetical protein